MRSNDAAGQDTVPVWDVLVRGAHWSLVVAVLGAWLARHVDALHEWLGYAAVAIVALRLMWGIVGTRYARFAQFVVSPAMTLRYATDVLAHRERRYLGHNPLGAWMIVLLLVTITLVALTGWLGTTDRFWGDEFVQEAHEALANALLTLIGLHVAGVAFSSWRHRENLVRAMLTGRKRAPAPQDVVAGSE